MEGRIHALNISWSALDKVRAEVRDDRSFEKSMIKNSFTEWQCKWSLGMNREFLQPYMAEVE